MLTAGLDAAAVGVAGHLAGGQYHGSFATRGSHCVQTFAAGQQEFSRDPLPVRPRKQRLRVRVLRHGHVDTAHRIDGVNGQHTGQQRRHHALDDVRQRLPAYGQPIRDLHGLGEFRHPLAVQIVVVLRILSESCAFTATFQVECHRLGGHRPGIRDAVAHLVRGRQAHRVALHGGDVGAPRHHARHAALQRHLRTVVRRVQRLIGRRQRHGVLPVQPGAARRGPGRDMYAVIRRQQRVVAAVDAGLRDGRRRIGQRLHLHRLRGGVAPAVRHHAPHRGRRAGQRLCGSGVVHRRHCLPVVLHREAHNGGIEVPAGLAGVKGDLHLGIPHHPGVDAGNQAVVPLCADPPIRHRGGRPIRRIQRQPRRGRSLVGAAVVGGAGDGAGRAAGGHLVDQAGGRRPLAAGPHPSGDGAGLPAHRVRHLVGIAAVAPVGVDGHLLPQLRPALAQCRGRRSRRRPCGAASAAAAAGIGTDAGGIRQRLAAAGRVGAQGNGNADAAGGGTAGHIETGAVRAAVPAIRRILLQPLLRPVYRHVDIIAEVTAAAASAQ